MTVPQFRRWLESKIAYIQAFDEGCRWQDDAIDIQGFLDEAYQHAVDLRLPECAAACKKGPVTVRLLECLNAIPEPKIKRVYENQQEAADRLGVSRRTIRRLIDDDELKYTPVGERYTFTEEQIQAYLAGEESETLFG